MLALPVSPLPLPTSARTTSGPHSLIFLPIPGPISALVVGIFLSQHIFTAPILSSLAPHRLFTRRQPLSTHLADQCPVTDPTPTRYGSAADIWYLYSHLGVA